MRNMVQMLLLTAMLLIFPASIQAQFLFTTNSDGSLDISQYTGSGGAVIIPSTTNGLPVSSIGQSAFFNCTSLTSVTIPNSVTSIGNDAFVLCANLTAITVAANNPSYSSAGGVLFDAAQATLIQFPEGNGASYTIPNSVTSIGIDAFNSCVDLTNVAIPNSVTNIASGAFYFCTGLDNVTIPNSITSIGEGAFADCLNLTNITIPNGVTSIGVESFEACNSLMSITIPKSVTNIGAAAFSNCRSLISVYCQGNAPSVGVFGFYDSAVIYYLPGTTGWNTFSYPTAFWVLPNPLILDNSVGFGAQNNEFGFTVSWATNASVVVEAATKLANPNWTPVATNTLVGGVFYFNDSQSMNYLNRFYRLRSP